MHQKITVFGNWFLICAVMAFTGFLTLAEENPTGPVTAIASTTIAGYVDASAHWEPGEARGYHKSGIVGQTTFGQICQDDVCESQPRQMTLHIESNDRKLFLDIETDGQGIFEIALKPGTYAVTPYFRVDAFPPLVGLTLVGQTSEITVIKKRYTVVSIDLGAAQFPRPPLRPPGFPQPPMRPLPPVPRAPEVPTEPVLIPMRPIGIP